MKKKKKKEKTNCGCPITTVPSRKEGEPPRTGELTNQPDRHRYFFFSFSFPVARRRSPVAMSEVATGSLVAPLATMRCVTSTPDDIFTILV